MEEFETTRNTLIWVQYPLIVYTKGIIQSGLQVLPPMIGPFPFVYLIMLYQNNKDESKFRNVKIWKEYFTMKQLYNHPIQSDILIHMIH